MKVIVALAALIAFAAAQAGVASLIESEVDALVAADSGLTVDACSTKCDALFDFINDVDEQNTDRMCRDACACKIDNVCHQPATTHAPDHTHPTHPDNHHPHHPPHHP